ncbi:ABC transporter permease [Candidatus Woesearchaeota archaeon]|nr:ABC transporter permease [Candidatus Woesearchaeota archaeon]
MNLLVPLMTIVRKETIRIFRVWRQSFLPSVVTTTLYFIIFGNFIGSRISDMAGFKYVDFIMPGLVMLSVITTSYTNVAGGFFLSKFQRSIEEMIVSPTPNWVIIAGHAIGGMVRGLVTGILVMLVSLFFTHIKIHNIWIILIYFILTSAMFSLAGFLNGMIANSFDDIALIPNFLLTPLIYLGGVFYSITVLPEFWQHISKFNPILYMVSGFRYGFLGFSDIDVFFGFVILLVFTAVFFIINMILMKKGYGIKS